MYKIFHNIDAEITTVCYTDLEFINFVNLIQTENEDDFILDNVDKCIDYINTYCSNLDLI